MKFGTLLKFHDPGALNGDLDRGEWALSWARGRRSTLEWIELSAVAWTDQALGAFVIGNGAPLVGTDS